MIKDLVRSCGTYRVYFRRVRLPKGPNHTSPRCRTRSQTPGSDFPLRYEKPGFLQLPGLRSGMPTSHGPGPELSTQLRWCLEFQWSGPYIESSYLRIKYCGIN